MNYNLTIEVSHKSDLMQILFGLKSILNSKNSMSAEIDLIVKPVSNRNWKKFLVKCQNSTIRDEIIQNKFFSYDNNLFRSSESGYQNDAYELNTFQIILSNIDVEFVKLYAENLRNKDDLGDLIVDVNPLKLLENTFLISYSTSFSTFEEILKRYRKRQNLKNKKIDLIPCYFTNSFVVKPKHIDHGGDILAEVECLKNIIAEKIENLNVKYKYFYDLIPECGVLFQFDFDPKELIELIVDDSLFIVEYCYNFSLLKKIKSSNVYLENDLSGIKSVDLTKRSSHSDFLSNINLEEKQKDKARDEKELKVRRNYSILIQSKIKEILFKKVIFMSFFVALVCIILKSQNPQQTSILTGKLNNNLSSLDENGSPNLCVDPSEKLNHRKAFSYLVDEEVEIASQTIILNQIYCRTLNEIIRYRKTSKCQTIILGTF